MLPVSLLQSQLAHNKKRINVLQEDLTFSLQDLSMICENIRVENLVTKDNPDNLRWLTCLATDKQRTLKNIQTTRKQLKQLAILQKAIKQEIAYSYFYNEIVFGGE